MAMPISTTPTMSKKVEISDALYEYALKYGVHEHPVLNDLRQFTVAGVAKPHMQISPDQGQFMGLLAKIIRAKKYLEIGVFTGYSSLVMALAMGSDAMVFALDNSLEHLEIAKQYWDKAGILKQFEVMHGSALDSLEALVQQNRHNYFDIAFIDANKTDYLEYYEYCYQLVRPGGLILIDNVLFHGQVLEEHPQNFVQAIKEFNQFIYTDKRVDISLLPIADGLTIAYKKEVIT